MCSDLSYRRAGEKDGVSLKIHLTGGHFKQLFLPFLHNGFNDLKPQTHGNCSSGWDAEIVWTVITTVMCFLDWPRYPVICPRFIIGQAKWLAPRLPFITAVLQISRQSAGEFPARGQMVEGPRQSLSAAIVVVCSPAMQLAEQQRAVVHFHISKKFNVQLRERLCASTHSLGCVAKYPPVLRICSSCKQSQIPV